MEPNSFEEKPCHLGAGAGADSEDSENSEKSEDSTVNSSACLEKTNGNSSDRKIIMIMIIMRVKL